MTCSSAPCKPVVQRWTPYYLAVSISDQQLVPSVHLQHCVGGFVMESAFMEFKHSYGATAHLTQPSGVAVLTQ